ncbi:hypothetical protein HWD96_26335 [Pseudomonas putida]|uniref:hypothetical protein n=1 Tax=Pseudomonas putida TaxID=303 RepID=UPI001F525072|nr:hypothetical protein [Pseudomonas putida]MCI1025737.1 hypothetical protein [Pseudomonas putida]
MSFPAIVVLGMWLYAIGSLATLPCKIVGMKRRSEDIRTFLTRRRLLFLGVLYLITAPLVGLLIIGISAAGVSGSDASGVSDTFVFFGWLNLWTFLVAGCVALVGACLWRRS